MQAVAFASNTRFFAIDLLKVGAALIIVGHHISAYTPFSAELGPVLKGVDAWIYDYGRMAVSIFLVIGGFLAAQSILSRNEQAGFSLVWKRYRRLMPLYAVAIVLTIIAVALVRPGHAADWLPRSPTFAQLVAHALLLQDVLGIEALSAGVWYVAIDFQLYSLLVLCLWLSQRLRMGLAQFSIMAFLLTAVSLFIVNRDSSLDWFAVYFMGAYGLGVFAALACQGGRAYGIVFMGLVLLTGLALLLDFRPRLLLAMATAAALFLLAKANLRMPRFSYLAVFSQSSYAIFLLHFAVIVVMSALWAQSGLQGPVAAIFFVLVTLAISLFVGVLAHYMIERRL